MLIMLHFAGLVQKPKGQMAETEKRGTRTDPEVARGTRKQKASRGLQHGPGSYVTPPPTERS